MEEKLGAEVLEGALFWFLEAICNVEVVWERERL